MSEAIKSSIVRVHSGKGQGSGFLLKGGYILTANHNIKNDDCTFYILNDGTNCFDQKVEVDTSILFPVRQPTQKGDFAVFKLKYPESLKNRLLPLLSEEGSTGVTFMCYGFPSDEKEGIGRAYNNGKVDAIGMPHDCDYLRINLLSTNEGVIKAGFSGSPIYDPIRKGVIGLILKSDEKVDAIGVGGTWIKQFIEHLPNLYSTKTSLFDKKEKPNPDYHPLTCNREDQVDKLKKYFNDHFQKREHQHIFLFGQTGDRPGNLAHRFLEELRSQRRAPRIDVQFSRGDHEIPYFAPDECPRSESELVDRFEDRLKANNLQDDYIVFFWRLSPRIWKYKSELELLAKLLDGSLFQKLAVKHRLIIFYELEPANNTSQHLLMKLLGQKSTCQASRAIKRLLVNTKISYCLIETWNPISEKHLENWFDKFCIDIAKARAIYRTWLNNNAGLDMAETESMLRQLIIDHNPDYQHLRS